MGDQYLSLLSTQKLPPRQWPNVLTDLTHENKNVDVKGRSIFDAGKSIQ